MSICGWQAQHSRGGTCALMRPSLKMYFTANRTELLGWRAMSDRLIIAIEFYLGWVSRTHVAPRHAWTYEIGSAVVRLHVTPNVLKSARGALARSFRPSAPRPALGDAIWSGERLSAPWRAWSQGARRLGRAPESFFGSTDRFPVVVSGSTLPGRHLLVAGWPYSHKSSSQPASVLVFWLHNSSRLCILYSGLAIFFSSFPFSFFTV